MSPIPEEEPKQVSSSGEIEERQEIADQQQSPLFTSSWTPLLQQPSSSMQTTAIGVPMEQVQSQTKGETKFTSASDNARAYSGHQVFHCTNRQDSALEGSTNKRSSNSGHDATIKETATEDAKLQYNLKGY